MKADRRGLVTLEDVARHAGVSLATASRALNGSERKVRKELQERVLASAAVLNYTPNAQAQAMARGRTNVIGLIVHDIADPYFASIAAGVIDAADQEGLLVTLASTGRSMEREVAHVANFRAQRAQGVIIVGSRDANTDRRGPLGQEVAAFEGGGGRAVLVSQHRLDTDTIVVENQSGARDLATELIRLGYRRHAILAGPPHFLTAVDRAGGYRRGLTAAKLSPAPNLVVHGDFTRDGGYRAAETLIEHLDQIDCVFAVNDIMAVGAMAAFRDHGISVPGDVALAGFDDIVTLRDVTPRLTTVQIPLTEIGAQALRLVLQEPGPQSRIRRVKSTVVLRESTPALHH
ncbi:LacI family transcriptional regulator [Mycobacterium sp. MS1601]|uniref:LacI family DNA-binding transcriptional regulator n=1 Tax=Mycobacterium sp. MS1601 TaxID=1936029 RepID=UPI000979426B|nr:LacI family DNA-binding transcriptional regulator [Mycobacterium sp. MS1601]AQA02990.1 LacI family transcriptional regulator [Mycobacterium sp. MS1601]